MQCFRSAAVACVLQAAIAVWGALATATRGETSFVLAVGDSMTEEYAFELPFSAPDSDIGNANARNWVEILRIWRGNEVWFGGYEQTAFFYGDWRNAGHELNFGVPGFTVVTDWFRVLNADQLPVYPPPSVTQIADFNTRNALIAKIPQATVAVILIGANDLKNDYNDIFNGTEAANFYTRIVNRTAAIHDFIRQQRANLPIVICTAPDVGVTPAVLATYNDPAKRSSARAKILALADQIRAMAAAKGATVADVHALTLQYEDANPFQLDGTVFIKDGHPENPPLYLFCKDGFHAGTALQALIANTILDAINRACGHNHPLLGNQEILRNVLGLDPGQPQVPEITVEQPTGYELTDGSGAVAFGLVTTSLAKTFTVRNTGTANLTGLAVTKDGPNAAEFTVNSGEMAATLPPGSSTTFTVTFTPVAPGSKSATVHLASNDADENPFDITMTAESPSLPNLVIEQPKGTPAPTGSTRSFGSIVMPKKPSLTFTVKNTGTANLTGTTATVTGPNAAEFQVVANLSAPIKPGKSKSFRVKFVPSSPGAKQAVLLVTSNDPDTSPYQVNLTATALARRGVIETIASQDGTGGPAVSPESKRAVKQEQPTATMRATTSGPPNDKPPAWFPIPPSLKELAGTSWTLCSRSVVSVTDLEPKVGEGRWTLTFGTDGDLFVADESGVGFQGTYACHGDGQISARIFPQSIEDHVRIAFGWDSGLKVTVDSFGLDLQVADHPTEPTLTVTLGFTAWLSGHDPDTRQTINRMLTYDACASLPEMARDPAAP